MRTQKSNPPPVEDASQVRAEMDRAVAAVNKGRRGTMVRGMERLVIIQGNDNCVTLAGPNRIDWQLASETR